MKTPSIFLLDKMPWEKQYTIRLHFPGIDQGYAFSFDEVAGETKEDAERMLRAIHASLPNVIITND